MRIPEELKFTKVSSAYDELRNERSEWEAEWRDISDYLLPGRGIYQTYSKPRKRKLTSIRVVNTIAEDALYVLTSGMHGGLTSPSRPWFQLDWEDSRLKDVEPLVAWMEEAQERLHGALHGSNFYSIINSFYIEYAGFGTGAIYVGEDTNTDDVAFRFELLTAGEFLFSLGVDGRPDQFFRTIFMTERQLYERFDKKNLSKNLIKKVERNDSGIDTPKFTLLEYISRYPYSDDKPWSRVFYEIVMGSHKDETKTREPLAYDGFYEFPYPTARWNIIGSDVYGLGPGSRALPDIRRLQEMEKAFLMATHKNINPPLNAPARMKGKLNTLPGGYNYYSNPQETVNAVYQIRFDYPGVSAAIERVEQRIRRNFFNDIFLTANRDPNATPYKATEVTAREQEKMLRLGPVIERLQHEFLKPLLERCFNIMLRKDMFPQLSPELAELAGDYRISLISPLATAQRAVALQGINSFLMFLGQAAQFDQQIMDNVDIDAAAREYADISGVRMGVLRPQEEVDRIRAQRAQAAAQEKAKQDALVQAQLAGQLDLQKAQAAKAQADAGESLVDAQSDIAEMGAM
jgi:hypothetical protein